MSLAPKNTSCDGQLFYVQDKEKFKKTLNELIPKLDNDINELFSLAEDTKFIQKENTEKMYDILKELDKIEFDFNELE